MAAAAELPLPPPPPPATHHHAALWAQATAIQSIKSLIPVTLDLKASNFTKWRNFLQVAVTQYALADHLVSAVPLATDPEDWLRMDSTVMRWLYGSINTDIVDMVMTEAPNAFTILSSITALFRDNQQARTGYLEQKFRNIKQGDKSVNDYCLEQKSVADALADNGAPVTDNALVWNTIKGLSDDFKEVGSMAPYMTPFPDFLRFRNLLLLHELKPSTKRSSTPGVFYSAPAPGGYRAPAPPAPPAYGAPPGYGAPMGQGAPAAPHRGRGKKRKTGYPSPAPVPTVQNPWTGAIHMYPMVGPPGVLGPRPFAPAPRPSYAPPRAPPTRLRHDQPRRVEFDPWGFSVKDLRTGAVILRGASACWASLSTSHLRADAFGLAHVGFHAAPLASVLTTGLTELGLASSWAVSRGLPRLAVSCDTGLPRPGFTSTWPLTGWSVSCGFGRRRGCTA
ncbi:hypothetical protein QYE76_030340 [Lolium multiflorum]|uniref:Retrotransposon gag domain-containing protein n=1 Tax=Lolium multiflorum TaxID=4521 RepID=A0AAD8QQ73_LOLMU|nr:hypothetical protein QYE76_030340 [Lolium multiflorum]